MVFVLLLAGAWRSWRDAPHVAAACAGGALLLACISDLVAFNWVNSMRPVAPMVPLALWALTRATAVERSRGAAADPSQEVRARTA